MMKQVLLFDIFSEKDPHLNAVENSISQLIDNKARLKFNGSWLIIGELVDYS